MQACNVTELDFLLSESGQGHSISGLEPGREVVEGDEVELVCLASKYLYQPPVWKKDWDRPHVQGQGPHVQGQGPHVRGQGRRNRGEIIVSISNSTEFSWEERLVWPNVSLDDEGEYACIASTDMEGRRPGKLEATLTVLPIQPPYVGTLLLSPDLPPPGGEPDQHERQHHDAPGGDTAGADL